MASVRKLNLPAIVPPTPAPATAVGSLFAGFDDHMERKEPGWKARRAAEKAERERQRLERRDAIIARYGSEKAALAPCARERLLRRALAQWRKPCSGAWKRWTASVDGCQSAFDPVPERVRNAVAEAYPLPATFKEALAEHDYWRERRSEIEDVLGPNGDDGLDQVARLRADMVRDMAEHQLPTETLKDLYLRFKMLHSEFDEPKIQAALFRDLEAMVLRSGDVDRTPANVPSEGAP